MNWSIELTQYDIQFKPRHAINVQTVANFIVEFTYRPIEYPTWEMHVDGAANEQGAGVGIAFSGPENHKVTFSLKFSFRA